VRAPAVAGVERIEAVGLDIKDGRWSERRNGGRGPTGIASGLLLGRPDLPPPRGVLRWKGQGRQEWETPGGWEVPEGPADPGPMSGPSLLDPQRDVARGAGHPARSLQDEPAEGLSAPASTCPPNRGYAELRIVGANPLPRSRLRRACPGRYPPRFRPSSLSAVMIPASTRLPEGTSHKGSWVRRALGSSFPQQVVRSST
jgi:hypothetical protein